MRHYKWNNAKEWFEHRIQHMNAEQLTSGILKLKEKLTNQQISNQFYHEMKESGYHDERIGEQWANASEWLVSYIGDISDNVDLRGVLSVLAEVVSDQMIQDEYQVEMEKEGFFDLSKEVSKEELNVGCIVLTYSKMSFLIIHADDEKRFQIVDLTNIKESKINSPIFDSLSDLYDWFQEPEDDGIESIIPYSSLQSFLETVGGEKGIEQK